MRELEKVVRPNVIHFNVVDPNTTHGMLRYVTLIHHGLCDSNNLL